MGEFRRNYKIVIELNILNVRSCKTYFPYVLAKSAKKLGVFSLWQHVALIVDSMLWR